MYFLFLGDNFISFIGDTSVKILKNEYTWYKIGFDDCCNGLYACDLGISQKLTYVHFIMRFNSSHTQKMDGVSHTVPNYYALLCSHLGR